MDVGRISGQGAKEVPHVFDVGLLAFRRRPPRDSTQVRMAGESSAPLQPNPADYGSTCCGFGEKRQTASAESSQLPAGGLAGWAKVESLDLQRCDHRGHGWSRPVTERLSASDDGPQVMPGPSRSPSELHREPITGLFEGLYQTSRPVRHRRKHWRTSRSRRPRTRHRSQPSTVRSRPSTTEAGSLPDLQ